jgi:hypothetical protein
VTAVGSEWKLTASTKSLVYELDAVASVPRDQILSGRFSQEELLKERVPVPA